MKADDLKLGCVYRWKSPMGQKDAICMGNLSGTQRFKLGLAYSARQGRINFFVIPGLANVGIICMSDRLVDRLITDPVSAIKEGDAR